VFFHPSKTLLYEMAFSSGKPSDGNIGYSRWASRPLPDRFPSSDVSLTVSRKSGFFDYEPTGQTGVAEWHLNFANSDTYSTWPTSLFAQDEMQVAEHPGLIALRMTAARDNLSMLCVENREPTPLLVTGVERRLGIDTRPNVNLPNGLYGNQFKRAMPEEIEAATTLFSTPLKSNLLAIEAPAYGEGSYGEDDITFILRTAFSGFAAARDEGLATLGKSDTCIHTGFWGCGAYGGNRVLMSVLQMLAADMAGISQIMFHVGDKTGDAPFDEALETYRVLRSSQSQTTEKIIWSLAAHHYSWGRSDGN
jgi:hypothetical protein